MYQVLRIVSYTQRQALIGVSATVGMARRRACAQGCGRYEIRDAASGLPVERVIVVNALECCIEWQRTPERPPPAVAALVRAGSKAA